MSLNLSLRQLMVFREVMRSGSVSEAAKTLHRSQPALSAMLSNMENELGFVLFERRGNRLMPKTGPKDRLTFCHQPTDQCEKISDPSIVIMHRRGTATDQPAVESRTQIRENPIFHRKNCHLPIGANRLDHRREFLAILRAGLGKFRFIRVGHQQRDMHDLPALHIYEPV